MINIIIKCCFLAIFIFLIITGIAYVTGILVEWNFDPALWDVEIRHTVFTSSGVVGGILAIVVPVILGVDLSEKQSELAKTKNTKKYD